MTGTPKNIIKEKQPDYLGHRQRLRTRFLLTGGKDMPDYEFLEFLLTMSIPRRDVKPLAKQLIKKFGSFAGVVNASDHELLAISGIKETTLALLKAIKEGAIRMQWQNLNASDTPLINNWDLMVDYCRMKMSHKQVEEFMVIYLNSKLYLIGEEIQQRGTLNQVAVHPREVIKSAMDKGAAAIILVHNHPSGIVKPSHADIEITKNIVQAGNVVDINVLDHLIISKDNVYSFVQNGIIKPQVK